MTKPSKHNHRGRGKERGRGFAELQQLEELWEVWAWWWRSKGRNRSMVPTVVPERGGEGRVDGAVLGCFDVEE
jgi:hypothetical protein